MELFKKYRPKVLEKIVGQDQAVKQIRGLMKKGFPHAVIFSGPSGVGKTTAARVMKKALNANNDLDYQEVNVANFRGIDDVRRIINRAGLSAAGGGNRLWVMDEVQQMTAPAQNAMLPILEDTPDQAYFIFCTTDPNKLIKAVRTRCTQVKFKLMADEDIMSLLSSVCSSEGLKIPKKVLDRIVGIADGSARKALVVLNQIKELEPNEMGDAVQKEETKTIAFELAKAIIFMKGPPQKNWPKIAEMIRDLEDDPEGVRQLILKFSETMLLKGFHRAAYVLECFKDPVHYTGRPGITLAAYDATFAKE